MVISFDPNILVSYYQSKVAQAAASASVPQLSGATGSGTSTAKVSAHGQYAPTPPWDASSGAARESTLVQNALSGMPFINQNAAQLDMPGASSDYSSLFALYQGLNTLYGLADQASTVGVSSYQLAQYQKAFQSGLTQVTSYVNSLNLQSIRVTQGQVQTSDTVQAVPNQPTTYTTKALHTGSSTDAVDAFQGDVQFNITIQRGKNPAQVIPIDLNQMGAQTRSMSNVVSFINDQLKAAGALTRVATDRIPGQPQTVTVGNSTVTLPATQDTWAMQFTTSPAESVSFSAASTNDAVYLTQTAGTPPDTSVNPNATWMTAAQKKAAQAALAGDETSQLVKFQTDGTTPLADGQPYSTSGRVFANNLPSSVGATHATAVGPDGSVYVLADIDGLTQGQTIKGSQDVALMKYDSAGNLVYSRDLGAGVSASGLSLAVSSSGQVAIAGSVTGSLDAGETMASATTSDSFVSLYDASGQEVWTQRRGASGADQANAVAFGNDGTVYVAGQTNGAMTGQTGGTQGGQDGYLMGITTSAKGLPTVKFTNQFGSSGSDAAQSLVVDGANVYVASNEQGHAVVRSFDTSGTGAPVQTAQRDLGNLGGGNIAGIGVNANGQVVVAGSSFGDNLNAGTVTAAGGGGEDGFVAAIDPSLSANASDTVAYYGGSGNDKVTGMAVSGNNVYLTGSAGSGDLPGLPQVGTKDGFLVSVSSVDGSVGFARRFTAKDGQDAPTSVAVAPGGASILDQLGLPQGTMNAAQSTRLIDNSSVRPGDSFFVKTLEGGTPIKVTIDASDTLDTLKTKIQRAAGFQVTVATTTVNGLRSLSIKPFSDTSTVEFVNGPSGHDALSALGINAGVVRNTTVDSSGQVVSADGKGQVYGLGLSSNLNLNSKDAIAAASSALQSAITTIVNAYNDMKTAATPKPKTPPTTNPSGTVPSYLKNQISNYTAALNRLTGGSSSGTGTASLFG
ncbi:hypothetical protein ACO2Q3_02745 [Caulobacter sp. KR2-114]|uniref:hypothetical protein n=1 Tax=Caulobacter sp. KR2-114 TaxID=3400912 RepID=UPI003C0F56BB